MCLYICPTLAPALHLYTWTWTCKRLHIALTCTSLTPVHIIRLYRSLICTCLIHAPIDVPVLYMHMSYTCTYPTHAPFYTSTCPKLSNCLHPYYTCTCPKPEPVLHTLSPSYLWLCTTSRPVGRTSSASRRENRWEISLGSVDSTDVHIGTSCFPYQRFSVQWGVKQCTALHCKAMQWNVIKI